MTGNGRLVFMCAVVEPLPLSSREQTPGRHSCWANWRYCHFELRSRP